MRTTLKIALPMIISVAAVSLLFAAYQVRTERKNLRNDLSRRAELLAESLQESIEPQFEKQERGSERAIQRVVDRFTQREHMKGIAVYEADGSELAMTLALGKYFRSAPATAIRAITQDKGESDSETIAETPMYFYSLPLHRGDKASGALLLVYDTSYIDSRVLRTLRDSLLTALLETILITALALVLVRWTFMDPLRKMVTWLQHLRAGGGSSAHTLPQGELFDQINVEVTHLARDLGVARAAAEEEARLRDSNATQWTAERLRVSLRSKLHDKPLFVVSNREPYIHMQGAKEIETIVPASGVVTALEPVLVACDGTWIAHGSGTADRQMVDAQDHLRVPPDHPSYTLRRVWLSNEEEKGYYQGFANEGLWPLCHIAHTRPTFRPEDWAYYQAANQKFADAVLQEMDGTESPILLAQDYHFALLPRMVKEARPDARIAIFWHIPWPNPEVFGICPWQRELVDGLLGADLIGFHTQTHCNNFLETVDRALEALTEWDRFAVNRQGHVTLVRPYPISVAFPDSSAEQRTWKSSGEERAALCAELGIEASLLGIGVDRVDYTKGILERFRGIERFLEIHPEYQKRFSFVQIGAPSRTEIARYQQFLDEVSAEAERINARFQNGRWKPILMLRKHHSHKEIARFYRAASVCLVTSLHDGMNLVAKEFVASRDDERGTLILSTFAGAALELTDALQINPYDVQQLAAAIYRSLEMPEDEQAARMRHMRKNIREHNVFRWAASLLSDLTEIRIDAPERVETSPRLEETRPVEAEHK
ncbi:MAG TPA: trehalose-6-phosphate synthase [Candidatus Dormibacteraeota bacterium]|jgi:alpha,alpha-trehalose-phosphate synthase [UDP-forming]|nr:trehalose-6-phosphate synthase [Candidatus Dormibacteraeota bacterium]